jgi:hypothetical protein
MIDRYAAVKPSLWPGAKAAIGKLSASAPTDISALWANYPIRNNNRSWKPW